MICEASEQNEICHCPISCAILDTKTNFMNNNIKSLAWKSAFPSLNLTSKDIVGLSVNSLNVVEKIPIRSLLQER